VRSHSLQLHGFIVEFFTDVRADPTTHHYTVTRAGSPRILAWGRSENHEKCEAEARAAINGLLNRDGRSPKTASSG
jgi:hypothetical protein